jgi:hypothetical protein
MESPFELLDTDIQLEILSDRLIQCVTEPICKAWLLLGETHVEKALGKWLDRMGGIAVYGVYGDDPPITKELSDACRNMKREEVSWKFYRMVQRADHKRAWINSDPVRQIPQTREVGLFSNIYALKQTTGKNRKIIPPSCFIHKLTHNTPKLEVTGETAFTQASLDGYRGILCSLYNIILPEGFDLSIGGANDFPKNKTEAEDLGKSLMFVFVTPLWDIPLLMECLTLIPKWRLYTDIFRYELGMDLWIKYCEDRVEDKCMMRPSFKEMASLGLLPIDVIQQASTYTTLHKRCFYAWLPKIIHKKMSPLFPNTMVRVDMTRVAWLGMTMSSDAPSVDPIPVEFLLRNYSFDLIITGLKACVQQK